MFIKQLKIYNFRNIIYKNFEFQDQINIFVGENGVGKTSILESIHYLSTGKSFRKGNYKNFINSESDELIIHTNFINKNIPYSLAVKKDKNSNWKSKLNSSQSVSQSDINNLFPVVAIDPDVHFFIDSGPMYRRAFIDWLVFHVKHDYITLWKRVSKCIKQLNFLYKNKSGIDEISLWQESLIKFTESLNRIRRDVFILLLPKVRFFLDQIQPEISDISIDYKQGWNEDFTLQQQLKNDINKNFKYGQLLNGPHKMDLKILVSGKEASKILSRGQKKILSIIFHLAYLQVLNEKDIHPVLCLDDYDAEIDEKKLLLVSNEITKFNSQVFVSSVHKDKIKKVFPQSYMFHVKHQE